MKQISSYVRTCRIKRYKFLSKFSENVRLSYRTVPFESIRYIRKNPSKKNLQLMKIIAVQFCDCNLHTYVHAYLLTYLLTYVLTYVRTNEPLNEENGVRYRTVPVTCFHCLIVNELRGSGHIFL